MHVAPSGASCFPGRHGRVKVDASPGWDISRRLVLGSEEIQPAHQDIKLQA